MVLLFSLRIAEWPPVWESAVHSVYCACLSLAFVKFCVCSSFPFGIEGRMWDVIVLIPDHWLSIYMTRNSTHTEIISRYSEEYYTLTLYIFINLLHYSLTSGEPVWKCRMIPSPLPATPSRALIPLGTSDTWFFSYFSLGLKRIMSSWMLITACSKTKNMWWNDKLCTVIAQLCQLSTYERNFTTRRL